MTAKFIDGYPMRVTGFREDAWAGRCRVVELEHVNRTQIKLTPRGARRLASMLLNEATKAERAR